MPKPRKAQVSLEATPYYHCTAPVCALFRVKPAFWIRWAEMARYTIPSTRDSVAQRSGIVASVPAGGADMAARMVRRSWSRRETYCSPFHRDTNIL
jgi:hypothetical protein